LVAAGFLMERRQPINGFIDIADHCPPGTPIR